MRANKEDTAASGDYPYYICADCGRKYGHVAIKVSSYYEETCGWCNEKKACTEPRDWGYPPFNPEAP
jgi:hypothetical protein